MLNNANTTMRNELISIIIPVKNGANFLQEALDHIKAQRMNVEIIVIDDGSEDNTSEIAIGNGCVVHRMDVSKGQVVAKNVGLKIAKGAYIMFHDHDDIMCEGALKTLYDAFDDDTAAVMAMVKDFYTPRLTEEQRKCTSIKAEPFYGLFTGAILTRKSAFDIIGDFNPSLNTGEIMEWEFKLKQNNLKIKKIDFVSTDRRIHSSNYGKTDRAKEFKDYAAVLRARIIAERNQNK